jgi:hypothetical protein
MLLFQKADCPRQSRFILIGVGQASGFVNKSDNRLEKFGIISEDILMSFLEVDSSYFPSDPSPNETRAEAVAWFAREVLGGYMLDGTPFDSTNDDQQQLPPGESITPKSFTEDEYDEPSYAALLLETNYLAVNAHQQANITNMPYLLNDAGRLFPWLRPGYIAVQIVPNYYITAREPIDPVECDQVIFRLPVSEEDKGAAFHGFEMTEKSEITDAVELGLLDDFLLRFALGSRTLMHLPGYLDGTYISRTPEAPLETEISYQLPSTDE